MAHVYFTANLDRHTACPASEFDAATVADLLGQYFERWPDVRGYILDDQGHVRKHIKVFVDGRDMRDRTGLSDALAADSRVHVFQALSGG
jgi:molybdopterin converting factor small subunit